MTQYSTGLNNTTSEFAYFTPLVKRVHAQADIIGPFLWAPPPPSYFRTCDDHAIVLDPSYLVPCPLCCITVQLISLQLLIHSHGCQPKV